MKRKPGGTRGVHHQGSRPPFNPPRNKAPPLRTNQLLPSRKREGKSVQSSQGLPTCVGPPNQTDSQRSLWLTRYACFQKGSSKGGAAPPLNISRDPPPWGKDVRVWWGINPYLYLSIKLCSVQLDFFFKVVKRDPESGWVQVPIQRWGGQRLVS